MFPALGTLFGWKGTIEMFLNKSIRWGEKEQMNGCCLFFLGFFPPPHSKQPVGERWEENLCSPSSYLFWCLEGDFIISNILNTIFPRIWEVQGTASDSWWGGHIDVQWEFNKYNKDNKHIWQWQNSQYFWQKKMPLKQIWRENAVWKKTLPSVSQLPRCYHLREMWSQFGGETAEEIWGKAKRGSFKMAGRMFHTPVSPYISISAF